MASVSRRSFLICRNFSPGIPVTDPANKSCFFHRRPAPTREKLSACADPRWNSECPPPSLPPSLPNFSTILARNGRVFSPFFSSLFYPSRGNIATFARFFIAQRIYSAPQVSLLLLKGIIYRRASRLILTVGKGSRKEEIWNTECAIRGNL